MVDLSAVTFLDIRGINSIVAADAAAREAGTALVVRGGGDQLDRLVQVCGLEGRLRIE